ncbi:hypothetical protein RJ640_019360 [Escallonia rubra]|uniref:Uncharacterized protein n=1 Tax=Escallonia rubra TaxID=112253 RepID=A0AA88UPI3_9ASTE|nr:hypothetical protein RJ640_019360 [Escallonia rubra]
MVLAIDPSTLIPCPHSTGAMPEESCYQLSSLEIKVKVGLCAYITKKVQMFSMIVEAAVFGNPKNFTPFHGPVLQYGFDPFQTNACAGDSGTIPTENNPGSGLSSVCQEDKNRLSPVMVFTPNFIPGRNVSPGN